MHYAKKIEGKEEIPTRADNVTCQKAAEFKVFIKEFKKQCRFTRGAGERAEGSLKK